MAFVWLTAVLSNIRLKADLFKFAHIRRRILQIGYYAPPKGYNNGLCLSFHVAHYKSFINPPVGSVWRIFNDQNSCYKMSPIEKIKYSTDYVFLVFQNLLNFGWILTNSRVSNCFGFFTPMVFLGVLRFCNWYWQL